MFARFSTGDPSQSPLEARFTRVFAQKTSFSFVKKMYHSLRFSLSSANKKVFQKQFCGDFVGFENSPSRKQHEVEFKGRKLCIVCIALFLCGNGLRPDPLESLSSARGGHHTSAGSHYAHH
jgi:hypothetical protein